MNQLEKQPRSKISSFFFAVPFFIAIAMNVPFYYLYFFGGLIGGGIIYTLIITCLFGLIISIMVGFKKEKRWTPYLYLFFIISNSATIILINPKEFSTCFINGELFWVNCVIIQYAFVALFFYFIGFIGLIYALFEAKKTKNLFK